MHPAGPPPPPPPPQNRSCPSPSLVQCSSPSPPLLQRQQQQHVIYGPITNIQPCPANIHPHCVYSSVQRNHGLTGASGSLMNQVPIRHAKMAKWQPKSKPPRGHHPNHHQQSHQQYCQPFQHQQTHVQPPLPYITKPLVLFDQCQTNQSTPGVPPSAASFVVASSSFAHGPYGPGDHYTSGSGLTLIPQPYFKPPEVAQAFCLLQERPQAAHHHQHNFGAHAPATYYNISSANSCNLQTIDPKPSYNLTNVTNHYGNVGTFGNNQIASGQAVSTSQIFQNSPMTYGTSSRDRMLQNVDAQAMACSRNLRISENTKHEDPPISRTENADWPVQTARETSDNAFEATGAVTSPRTPASPIQTNRLSSATITKNQDERYSDESAASFDFTIEAEKMVSALCNTVSSNELGKDESCGKNEASPSFGGAAGDNITNKTNMWFADFCTEYGVSVDQSNRTASTQTQEDRHDSHRYPEIMRKTIYWGCNEAETILNSSGYRSNAKAAWLANISSATRTALTKSSTCFPIFSGDRAFVRDLINSLLRISNGWLVLDNYFNKQHYPSLDAKFDRELTSRFQTWEVVTQDLLRELIKTLVNIEENIGSNCSSSLETLGFQEHPSSTSFPGDVNLYTNNDLFDSSQFQPEHFSKLNDGDSTYTLQYPQQSISNANFPTLESRQQQSQKETKLRSKWTITENLSSNVDGGKSIRDISLDQNDVGFSGNGRFRVKNSSNASTTKITASSRHSLNAEFFHLQNKVMESMGNTSELERQRWGLKEQEYNFVFGTSRGENTSGIVPGSCEPIFKFKSVDSSSYENAYGRRCLPRMDSTNPVNQATMSHCTNVNGSVYLVAGTETALDSTYIGGIGSADHKKAFTEPDYTGNIRIAELNEHSRGSGLVVSATSISSIRTEPVYVGKCSSDHRELAAVPRTKMTLLSQIEGNGPSANRETKEMTANLSAWFASMRNSNGPRTINCPVDGRNNENASAARASAHPQETSRSAMDLSRQLQMDGNRQLQTLQNMQAIQSQPWNAANLLNNKRTTANVQRSLDEYDSSEDVRVYMKPGSYNVPKKRHHRKNARRIDNLASSRGNNINNNTPRSHSNRAVQGVNYNSGAKNQSSTSVSSLLIASSVQVSTTTTTTSTSIRVPFPAIPIVLPPSNFTPRNSPRILRRVRRLSNEETQRDVAWKAACASAEILLEALNVKATNDILNNDSPSPSSMKNTENDSTPRNRDERSMDRSSSINENVRETLKDDFCDASSYEASEDDSSFARKFSPERFDEQTSCDSKHMKNNVKTDTWLIRTFNNASMVSSINTRESDHESTIDESVNSSMRDNLNEYKSVVTSTPEPIKITSKSKNDEGTMAENKLAGNFHEESITEMTRDIENVEQSASNDHRIPSRNLSISLIDTSAEFVGRATYSETVRRSTGKSSCPSGKTDFCRSRQTRSTGSIESTIKSTIIPIPGRKCQRRDNDRARQSVHKSRRTIAKRLTKNLDDKDIEEGRASIKIVKDDTSGNNVTRPLAVKCQTKKKDNAGTSGGWTETKTKISERGWSVWYSSRRKQMLSTLALDKLATIHQTVWQMDDAKLLKHPSSCFNGSDGPTEMIDDDRKINKSPIFLETIGYKLKNRIYHKIEHVMRDFRKIVNNSKSYHKNDTDRIVRIETLSKKLEELFNEHFSNWDFDNASESPRNNSGLLSSGQSSKCKSPRQQHQQKLSSCRLSGSTKKNSAASTKNEC